MLRTLKVVAAAVSVFLLLPAELSAQMTFKKVEVRTAYGRAEEGDKGKLIVDGNSIRFVDKNERDEYFPIPSKAVTEVFYSRVSGRRIKTAIFLTGPLGLFLKGKKHYMTLSFDDGADIVGAVEFKLDKKNYRGVLRAVEQVAGVELVFDQEGIKDEKETVAGRSGGSKAEVAVLRIQSDPEDAEIEIDGAFAGSTPRTKNLKPGEYKIKITKKGYKNWERKMKVEAGEEVPIMAELEQK
ncbi:PEGA domain-containing protein [Acidobacteria bacterium AH-259-L09]|nr:PEGA domain-containing protein [Acidobacteria bacterium AH-259-L09]